MATPRKRLNILLADDGSEHAQAAIALLQEIPLPPKTRVLVTRVFPPGLTFAAGTMETMLERTKAQFLSKGVRVDTNLVLGYPSEKILDIAKKEKPHLIVLGAKGLRATLGIFLGGVAQQVAEYAPCPVLVVRAPFRGMRRVLVLTDGSPHSLRAVRYLGKFPLPARVDVRLMHVLPPLPQLITMEPDLGAWRPMPVVTLAREEEQALLAREERKGRALLERTRNLLLRYGIESTPVLARGDAATEIIQYVKHNEIDLIVAGSRGLSQLKGLLMGSVSRKLIHYSNCSILIVKGPAS